MKFYDKNMCKFNSFWNEIWIMLHLPVVENASLFLIVSVGSRSDLTSIGIKSFLNPTLMWAMTSVQLFSYNWSIIFSHVHDIPSIEKTIWRSMNFIHSFFFSKSKLDFEQAAFCLGISIDVSQYPDGSTNIFLHLCGSTRQRGGVGMGREVIKSLLPALMENSIKTVYCNTSILCAPKSNCLFYINFEVNVLSLIWLLVL